MVWGREFSGATASMFENDRHIDKGFFNTLSVPAKIYENCDGKVGGDYFEWREGQRDGWECEDADVLIY